MLFLYDLGIRAYYFLVLLASLKNKKARAWIEGRRNIIHRIDNEISTENERAWFHFASLGEFEQGRPVLEDFKSQYPGIAIVITFFSPSGYEIRKDYQLADHVFYLPLDTPRNAREFVRLVNPSIAVFTKYEYWYHYFKELHDQDIPLFIVSGIFRQDQPFFKWYGGLHRKMLIMVSYFFVQNDHSKNLLKKLGITNVGVTGDTRFDRVAKNISHVTEIPAVKDFCGGSRVFIAGSSWPQDEVLIAGLAERFSDWKFIIAPHEIDAGHIKAIEKLFPNSVKLSEIKPVTSDKQVLIIDNIGMLSSLYQYGDIAYIGGGFGAGIHNTQEASAFGLPVIFGPNYDKFQEAIDLIEKGASFTIKDAEELQQRMSYLEDPAVRNELGTLAKEYVMSKAGATKIILDYIKEQGFFKP
ncbi:glycosyltransferase N-terminal domain-containing protein [Daejeonella sp.]|uniref:3-deoxy-D-manno-octulosonic acid transferase n=1 Tax=Daejeonella sp. TaxID=2805397 RepID=UPI0030BB6465